VVGIVPRLNSGSWRTVREMSRSGSGKELLAWAGIDADHIAASSANRYSFAVRSPKNSAQLKGGYRRLFNTYRSTAVAKPSSSDEVVL